MISLPLACSLLLAAAVDVSSLSARERDVFDVHVLELAEQRQDAPAVAEAYREAAKR